MLERFLINFDVGISGALLRIALGSLLVPVLRMLRPEPAPWMVVVALLVMLFAVKAVAAVGRRVVPATDVARKHWAWRRDLASYHDSYQWRKLLWIGIGLVIAAVVDSPAARIQWVLGALCILAGTAAEILWRREGIGLAPPGAG